MDFTEIQAQIDAINQQMAEVVKKAEDRTEIDAIQMRLEQVEKTVKQTKHDQIATKVMDALRREQGM